MSKKTEEEILRLRRNLSGCYIFDTLPQDNGERKPTCIEDCRESTLRSWLWSQVAEGDETDYKEFLTSVCDILNQTMGKLKEMFTKEEASFLGKYELYLDPDAWINAKGMIDDIVRFCGTIKIVASYCGICAPGSEAALTDKTKKED